MTSTPSYDEIFRIALHRIATSKLATKVVMPLVTSGLTLITLNTGSLFTINGKITLGPVQISIDNEPNWLLIALGAALVAIGLWILYMTQIKVVSSPYENIQALQDACAEPSCSNTMLQERFFSVYKFKASVVAIRYLLQVENPYLSTLDYKCARSLVECDAGGFKLTSNANLKFRERWASIGYFFTAFPSFFSFVSGTALVVQPGKGYVALGAALLALAVVLAVLAWLLLDQVKILNSAMRLLALPDSSGLAAPDFDALERLMSNLHIPTVENFIDKGHLGYFYSPILNEVFSYRSIFETATFQMSHAPLKEQLGKFFNAWKATLSYGQYFYPTGSPDLLRFNFLMDLLPSQPLNDLHDQYLAKVVIFEQEFKGLIVALHKYAPNLDIYRTSSVAQQNRVVSAAGSI